MTRGQEKRPRSHRERELRLEATLHAGERHEGLERIPGLDLDRLPSPPGEVRVLLTPDEAIRLVELGFEVRLLRAHPVRPLDSALTADDRQALAEVEKRLGGLRKE